MKWNCFDWFDHYAAEKNGVPKLETQPIHTDAIWKRVQEQTGIAPQPKRNRMHITKWVAGIAAAAVLVTGGTIASEITESGLSPQLTTEQILHYCPDISGFCSVDCLQLCNLDSTNVAPEHWQRMADSIRKEYNHYDGFVLTHGTDTMAYTAAALSYLIQYSKKPIKSGINASAPSASNKSTR